MYRRIWKGFQTILLKRWALLGLALGMLWGPWALANTYRWVGEDGSVHYSDQVPPEEAKQPRTKLSPSAKPIQLIEGAKTQEQLVQAKRLKQLRSEQQHILAEQKARDLSLLRTYHSEEEMQMALQGKLNTVESSRKIIEANRQHQEEILQSLVTRAADSEMAGQAVPKNLLDSIQATRAQIATYQEQIRLLENTKAEIAASFGKDLNRFKSLAALRNISGLGSQDWRTQDPQVDVGILSAVSCPPLLCDKAWAMAKEYLKSKLGRHLVTETETILQTAIPHEPNEIGVLVVRIRGKTEDTLFLDTSCQPSSLGDELCTGPLAREIRAGFSSYLEQGLNAVGR